MSPVMLERMAEAVSDAIEVLGAIPSGHLYARLMSAMSLDEYQDVLGWLQRAGRIEIHHHCIIWKDGR